MRNNYTSTIPEESWPYTLPNNWTWFFWSDLIVSFQQGMIRSNRELGAGNAEYLKMGDLDGKGAANLSSLPLTNATQKEMDEYTLKEGDLLINVRNSRELVGKTCVIENVDKRFILYNHMLVRIGHGDVKVNYFVNAFLNIPSSKKLLDRIKQGTTTVIALYQRDLLNLPIPLPDTLTFNSIISFYNSINSKIELNKKINAELEAMAKLVYDYWFVQFDFPNAKGKSYKANGGKMVWSVELRKKVPQGWKVKELVNVTSLISRGISPSYAENGGVYVINQKCIRDNAVNFGLSRRHNNSVKDASSKQVKLYDILVNSTGVGTLGRVAIFKRMKEAFVTVDSHVTIVRADKGIVDPLYFGFSMLQKQTEIEKFSQGSTGQTELSRDQLESIKILVPSEELQKKFNSFYRVSIEKMASLEAETEILVELRDWLLPMLMNGQVTIKAPGNRVKQMAAKPFKTANTYFHQTQVLGAIINASKQKGIKHGEMTLAKYSYLVDRLYNIPTSFMYDRWHLGPYPTEMKKVVNNKQFFKIHNNEVSVVPQKKEYNFQFQQQVEEAVAELASIFNQDKGKDRSHQTELLATVCKVVEDIQSADFKSVRESMKKWPIELKGEKFKNKADKFGEEETKSMLKLIDKKEWSTILITRQ